MNEEEGKKLVLPKKTVRHAVLKLELSGSTDRQLEAVAKNLYGLETSHTAAKNSQHWSKVDEELFAIARGSYDGMLAPFTEKPKVYKFVSTRQKIWDDFVFQEKKRKEEEAIREIERQAAAGVGGKRARARVPRAKDKSKDAKSTEKKMEVETLEQELETFLDPFEVAPPWKREFDKDGRAVYINMQTQKKQFEKPDTTEIWATKVELLEKLTPRDDLDGYEYKENLQEKRKRLRIFEEYEKNLQAEILRREEDPTELEQVEDVLFYLVDTIATIEDMKEKEERRKARQILTRSWHVATKGRKFKPLGHVENEEGEIARVVSDLEFRDMLVSEAGTVVALTTPPGLFEGHEREREEQRRIEEERQALIELDRQRPLKEKAKEILALARSGDHVAAKEKVKDEISWRVARLPTQLRKLNKFVLEKSKIALVHGARSLLKASKDPKNTAIAIRDSVSEFCYGLLKGPPTDEELHLALLLDEVKKEEEAELKAAEEALREASKPIETEEQRKLREYRAHQPKPIKFVDTVQVTLTLLLDPPPTYEMKVPRSEKEEFTQKIYQKLDSFTRNVEKMTRLRKSALRGIQLMGRLPKSGGDDQSVGIPAPPSFDVLGEEVPNEEFVGASDHALTRLCDWIVSRKAVDVIAGTNGSRYICQKEFEDILLREHEWRTELKKQNQQSDERTNETVPLLAISNATPPVEKRVPKNSKEFLEFGFSPPPEEPKRKQLQPIEKPPVKEIADFAVREAFEKQLLNEISNSVSLPQGNIQIEEIRRLPPNDSRVLELKQRRAAILAEQRRLEEINKMQTEFDKERRKALIDGTFDEQNWQARLFEASQHISNGGTFLAASVKLSPVAPLPAIPETSVEADDLDRDRDSEIENNHASPRPVQPVAPVEERESSVASEASASSPPVTPLRPSPPPSRRMSRQLSRRLSHMSGEVPMLIKQLSMQMKEQAMLFDNNSNNNNGTESVVSSVEFEPLASPRRSPGETQEQFPVTIFQFANIKIMETPSSPSVVIPSLNLSSAGDFVGGANETPNPAGLSLSGNPENCELITQKSLGEPDGGSIVSKSTPLLEPSIEISLQASKTTGIMKSTPIVEEKEDDHSSIGKDSAVIVEDQASLGEQTYLTSPSHVPPPTAAPERPPYFKPGISNPDELKRDPRYWLSHELRELNTDEKRQRRIAKLKLSVHETGLKLRLKQLKDLRNEIIFDASMYADPVIDVLAPLAKRAQEKLAQSKSCAAIFSGFSSFVKARPSGEQHPTIETSSLLGPTSAPVRRYEPEVVQTMSFLIDTVAENCGVEFEVKDVLIDLVDEVEKRLNSSSPRVVEIEQEEASIAVNLRRIQLQRLYYSLTEGLKEEKEEEEEEDGEIDEAKQEQEEDQEQSHESWHSEGVPEESVAQRTTHPSIIVSIVDSMCLAIESLEEEDRLKNDQAKAIVPRQNNATYKSSDLVELDRRVWSCEITLTIFVGEEQRKIDGLEDIEAEDIAVMLREQVNDRNAVLCQGELTRHVLDVRYKHVYKQRVFPHWECFWIHVIHPIFFGYHIVHHAKRRKENDNERTASGIRVYKPSEQFSERSKYTYTTLMAKEKEKSKSSRRKSSVVSIEESSVVSGSRLTIYRPKMSELTKKDVERCRRVHRAFEQRYEEVMSRGLVDGKRLRPDQFAALRDRDAAYRIYRSARQKLNALTRKTEEDNTPKIQLTEINDEVFQGWVQEIKEEEKQKLLEQRKKAERDKKQRQQESHLKNNSAILRSWLISMMIKFSVSPIDIAQELDKELALMESEREEIASSEVQSNHIQLLTRKYHELRLKTIEEEKRTRKLFSHVLRWVEREGEEASQTPMMLKQVSGITISSSGKGTESETRNVAKADLVLFLSTYFTAVPGALSKKSSVAFRTDEDREQRLQAVLEKGTSGRFSTRSRDDSTLDRQKKLAPADIQVCQSTRWVEVVRMKPELLEILSEMPTMIFGKFARDELIQFASLMAELEPIYSTVVDAYLKQKEDAKLKAKNIGARKESRKLHAKEEKEKKRKAEEQAVKDKAEQLARKLAEEAEALRLAEEEANRELTPNEKRVKRRVDDGRLEAHQHRFIQVPGEDPMCIVCFEKRFDFWCEDFENAELEWRATFDDELLEDLVNSEPDIRDSVQEEFAAYLQLKATQTQYFDRRSAKVKKEIKAGKRTSGYETQFEGKQISDLCPDEYHGLIAELLKSDPELLGKRFSDALAESGDCFMPPRLSRDIVTPLQKTMPLPFLLSGLSVFDPKGKPLVLPPEPEDEEKDKAAMSQSLKRLADDEEEDDRGNPPLGLRIRLWHYDSEELTRGAFLGEMKLGYEDVMNPPKGSRAYAVSNNSFCQSMGGFQEAPQGTVTVRVTAMNRDKESKEPTAWRLEIIRATGLLPVTNLNLCSASCEVFWRGPAEKNEKLFLFKKWIKVGDTKVIYNTLNPTFPKKEGSLFDFPPVWTDLEIEGRGANFSLHSGGGWVARNNIPDPKRIQELKAELEKKMKTAKDKKQLVSILSANERSEHAIAQAVDDAVQARTEMTRLLWNAEELERMCMSKEEEQGRRYLLNSELERCRVYTEKQIELGTQFTKVLQYIQGAPAGLLRQRFRMGSVLDSGGLRAEVFDPTTNKQSFVFFVPILYPEDEAELTRQLGSLLGCPQPNLIKIIDYSTHNYRSFTPSGFPAFNDRIVIARLEKVEDGIPVLEYINSNWDKMTDDGFKKILKDVLAALEFLHQCGIAHRNIHPGAVLIHEIKRADGPKKGLNPTSSRLGEYWFLENPRKLGCAYSASRADWGAKSYQPPEVARGQVDVQSDIYAFGMCAFYWACGGLDTLQYKPACSLHAIERLKGQIPLKWGDWLHAMLRQCLQPIQASRPTATELLRFLNSQYYE